MGLEIRISCRTAVVSAVAAAALLVVPIALSAAGTEAEPVPATPAQRLVLPVADAVPAPAATPQTVAPAPASAATPETAPRPQPAAPAPVEPAAQVPAPQRQPAAPAPVPALAARPAPQPASPPAPAAPRAIPAPTTVRPAAPQPAPAPAPPKPSGNTAVVAATAGFQAKYVEAPCGRVPSSPSDVTSCYDPAAPKAVYISTTVQSGQPAALLANYATLHASMRGVLATRCGLADHPRADALAEAMATRQLGYSTPTFNYGAAASDMPAARAIAVYGDCATLQDWS